MTLSLYIENVSRTACRCFRYVGGYYDSKRHKFDTLVGQRSTILLCICQTPGKGAGFVVAVLVSENL